MKGLALTLPGGIERSGKVFHDALLKPLNGRLERAISEELDAAENLPESISNVLLTALDRVGGIDVERETVTSLCVADRQFIMLRLGQMIDGDLCWLNACCSNCSELFDVSVKRSELPVRKAGASFPFVEIEVRGHRLHLRVPNGDDQALIANLDESQALPKLLSECCISITPKIDVTGFAKVLSDDEIDTIDSALESVSPAVCTSILTRCPECYAEQTLFFDPYGVTSTGLEELYLQVHNLAYAYHWSESDILALPRATRHLYLRLIDSTEGRYS